MPYDALSGIIRFYDGMEVNAQVLIKKATIDARVGRVVVVRSSNNRCAEVIGKNYVFENGEIIPIFPHNAQLIQNAGP